MKEKTKILLLEDNPIHREILADELQDDGCEVRSASDLKGAEEILAEFRPDVFLFDIVLFGNKVKVIELVKRLRAAAAYKDTPVLFVTAYQREIGDAVTDISNSTVVEKPFTFEALLSSMSKLGVRI